MGPLAHILIVIGLLVLPVSQSARAVLVNWDTQSWTPGNLSNALEVDGSNAGNDVTVTVSGDTGDLSTSLDTGSPQTPAITGAFDGGLFDIDFRNSSGTGYQDQISSITATSTTGGSIAPTISGVGANVTLSGSGLAQVLNGQVSTPDRGGLARAMATRPSSSMPRTFVPSLSLTAAATCSPTPPISTSASTILSISPPRKPTPGWFCAFGCGALCAWAARERLRKV